MSGGDQYIYGSVMNLRDRYGLSAGFRYSNGQLHASWDIPCPTGTEVRADRPGTVTDLNDGIPNNRPGHNPGTGAPSNWVLLSVPFNGAIASVYYQHLSPGIGVRVGQHVEPGDLIARGGNSGNSSGPHLHVTTARPPALRAHQRYRYLADGSYIYPPSAVLDHDTDRPPPPPDVLEEEFDMSDLIIRKSGGEAWWRVGASHAFGLHSAAAIREMNASGVRLADVDDKTFQSLLKGREKYTG